MYFENNKKTYYRFPSSNSIHNLDARYYFPEKNHGRDEEIGYEASTPTFENQSKDYYNLNQ